MSSASSKRPELESEALAGVGRASLCSLLLLEHWESSVALRAQLWIHWLCSWCGEGSRGSLGNVEKKGSLAHLREVRMEAIVLALPFHGVARAGSCVGCVGSHQPG